MINTPLFHALEQLCRLINVRADLHGYNPYLHKYCEIEKLLDAAVTTQIRFINTLDIGEEVEAEYTKKEEKEAIPYIEAYYICESCKLKNPDHTRCVHSLWYKSK